MRCLFVLLFPLLTACSTASPAPTPAKTAGATCTSAADCTEDERCVFTTPGCESPRGTCTRVPLTAFDGQHKAPSCGSLPGGRPLCTCDGRELATSCPAFQPFVRDGACPR